MARGYVVARSGDPKVSMMGKSYANPKLSNLEYLTLSSLGVKLQSYPPTLFQSQCVPNVMKKGSEYLLLESLINYCKDNKAIFLLDQQTRVWGRPVTHKTTAG